MTDCAKPIRRILVIFVTRPEANKLIPVVRALQGREGLIIQILAIEQYDVLRDRVLDLRGLRPELALDLQRKHVSLAIAAPPTLVEA